MSAKMYRSQERIIAGVCGGLAEHLGIKVRLLRVILIGTSFFFGAGLVFYVWLWLLVPMAGDQAEAESPLLDRDGNPRLKLFRPAPEPSTMGEKQSGNSNSERQKFALGFKDVLIGGGLVIAALAVFGQQAGWNLQLGTLIPLLIIALGAVLAWMQLDNTRRVGLLNAAKMDTPMALLRLGGGIVLVIAGVIVIVAGSGSWQLVWSSVVASLAVLAGVGLVLAPWALKFWREFQNERAGRIRETERAEIAAHLHDSVLQTLALIQKRAHSAADVTRLARAQERELREWIYQDNAHSSGALVERVKAVCAEAEDLYGQAVEVVAVGDAELTEHGNALVQAVREAVLNGVRHGGTTVSVYVEAGVRGVDVFIKDRGPGFDISAVPSDRLGVRESVVGRMQRNGGTAEIISSAEGTEVRLHLPIGTPVTEDTK
ncbi:MULTISPECIES: ATP-binding protein [Arthrobacter]|uniref:ATP-binding protein n=1 Tax=unclassified Arthrobacter TaxID=235627 RepID=UPI0024B9D6DB|nr:ATP-binding protein [Arthrobacter sp. H35-MC1]MDJ0317016.1 PspC domain-containing protein [Arthrobacter sp. H35-MC1]